MLLSVRSKYFKKLFGETFSESSTNEVEIRLGKNETVTFRILIQFVYSMMCNSEMQSSFLEDKSIDELVKISVLADRFLFLGIISYIMLQLINVLTILRSYVINPG